MNQFCSEVRRTQQLVSDGVTTSDETPLETGAGQRKEVVRKPRHPPAPPSLEPGVDFSRKSVLLFPGQGFQFVGMGKKVLGGLFLLYFFPINVL